MMTKINSFLKDCLLNPFKIEKLKGDSRERRYFRVHCPKKTFILSCYPKNKNGFKDFLKIQKLCLKNKIPVPKVLHHSFNKGFILMEDLGDLSLECYYLKTKNLKFHLKSVDLIFQFQNLLKRKAKYCQFTKEQSFKELSATFNFLRHPFKQKQKLFKEFESLSGDLLAPQLEAGHRDFHSRNIFIHEQKLFLIDFQDAGFYPLFYDLASLTVDPYAELKKNHKQELIQHFSKKKKVDPYLFSLTEIQRGLKAVGSFMSFYRKRRQKSHLCYIRPVLMKLRSTPELKENFPFIFRYIHELLRGAEILK